MIRPIRSEADYQPVLNGARRSLRHPRTPDADEVEVLASLIERYEEEHFVLAAPTPLAPIQLRIEQQGLESRDLAKILAQERGCS